jgi:hypothetical protein
MTRVLETGISLARASDFRGTVRAAVIFKQ